MSELDDLLAAVRSASPGDRIAFRAQLAAYGADAIEVMRDWLVDPQVAGFAVRVLEQIGHDDAHRAAVHETLTAIDPSQGPSYLSEDVDWALRSLGYAPARKAGARRSSGAPRGRRPGSPGVRGRGYWVMRTSPWERPFIWAEAREGRLRQGWGAVDEQDLEVLATAIRAGDALTPTQEEARGHLRMLTSWEGGMRVGDVVVAPNLPDYGRLSIFRVTDSYRWAAVAPLQWGERFGHILPVELLAGDIGRHEHQVSESLRVMTALPTRLYGISEYGGDVERLIGGDVPDGGRAGEPWTYEDYETLFGRWPPNRQRPTDEELAALAAELGRSLDAVSWQWSDGAEYTRGHAASTTSDALMTWIDARFGKRRPQSNGR